MDSVLKATRSVLQTLLLCSKCNDFKFVVVQFINVEVIQVCVLCLMKKIRRQHLLSENFY